MADIVLATINAKYIHAAFGLRYLLANLGELQARAHLLEFTDQQTAADIVEAILSERPRIVGLGIYVWNARKSRDVVAILKRLRPDLHVVVGGPEVSHEVDEQEVTTLADFVVTGEAEHAFRTLCATLLGGGRPPLRVIRSTPPDLTTLALPYDLYTADDIAYRLIYVEASRGCPYTCEFCLSALDDGVRMFPLEPFLGALDRLWQRGVRHFKFVDRTFNLRTDTCTRILRFFLDRYEPGLFAHFELIPDRLPGPLRPMIAAFPAGSLQFEIGIQTFNPEVAARIGRRQDNARAEENLRFLRESTGIHLHTDLIAGLPGESLASFAAGFDRLMACRPHEIQLGILKRLRGAPIARHAEEFGLRFSDQPPYEILESNDVDFATMQRVKRFAQLWDRVVNSGRFVNTAPHLWDASAISGFMAFTDWVYAAIGATHSIALPRLARLVARYLREVRQRPDALVNRCLLADEHDVGQGQPASKRQARHLAAAGATELPPTNPQAERSYSADRGLSSAAAEG